MGGEQACCVDGCGGLESSAVVSGGLGMATRRPRSRSRRSGGIAWAWWCSYSYSCSCRVGNGVVATTTLEGSLLRRGILGWVTAFFSSGCVAIPGVFLRVACAVWLQRGSAVELCVWRLVGRRIRDVSLLTGQTFDVAGNSGGPVVR
jgi:hypothetical protein